MQTHDIRQRFLDHFSRHGHTVVPSASLVSPDPTVLFTIAGMAPFKPYFAGEVAAPYARAVSVQKCVRTSDIDNVGHTTRHLTFFQMAGNFSFGDYFKPEAIRLAWQLLTTSQAEGGYGFEPERLWATVYTGDDEAEKLWQEVAGLPPERIQRRGAEDNYWDMGVAGPGGPCSEIYYDRGPAYGAEGGPIVDEDRYLEIWNLVFMQDERGELGPKEGHPPVGELPQKNIDTGLGIERVAFLLQGVDNVYETDLMQPVIATAERLTGKRYGDDEADDVRFRVIADHTRSSVLLISDGVTPGNEARSYVLRRLLRRIVRSARLLGTTEPVLGELTAVVREVMGPSYPELLEDLTRIDSVVRAEEQSFLATLTTGSRIFDTAAQKAKSAGQSEIAGDQAFALHDTYGFPIDLTVEMAAEQGLSVQREEFERLMAEQRRRAKSDASARKLGGTDVAAYREVLEARGPTEFLGYTDLEAEARVVGLLVDGAPVPVARAGSEVELVLDRTPFYAEGGGQIGDAGILRGTGVQLQVHDVVRAVPGLFVHRATVLGGEVALDTRLEAHVDATRRQLTSKSHSATHLVHAAVRNAYGRQAAQAGSLNEPGRMRFDFTTSGGVSTGSLSEVEEEVNAKLAENTEVRSYVTSMDDAMDRGAIALFGEKYGDQVRVVDMGDYSRELCGGTHVGRIGELGMVKLVADSSIGSGVHRVEALVGVDALRHVSREQLLLTQVADQVKAPREELPDRVGSLLERLRNAEREIERLRVQQVLSAAGAISEQATTVAGISVVAVDAGAGIGGGELRSLAGDVRGKLGEPAVVGLFSAADAEPAGSNGSDGKVSFVVAISPEARQRGLDAGELVRAFAAEVDGRGGGKPELAQGGGANASGVPRAIETLRQAVAARSGR